MEDKKIVKLLFARAENAISELSTRFGKQLHRIAFIFYENVTEFTRLTGDSPIYLTGANQSVRVQIDEEGVKAAAYIEIPGAGSAAPPEDIIDFVLDRPFLFVITSDNIPLFVGCVNNPGN